MGVNSIGSIGVDDVTFRWRNSNVAGPAHYLSGALFVSGGKLIFVGNAGPETITSA